MEPDTKKTNTDVSTLNNLHDEGVDIVPESGVAEENEFSSPETAVIPKEEIIAPEISKTENLLTPKSANLIASLQEIPKTFITPTEKNIPETKKEIAHEASLNDPSIKQIRTFKSDAEEAIRYKNISTIDIAIAEQKKRERETPIEYEKSKTLSPVVFIPIILVLLILISGGWYYWFSSSQVHTDNKVSTISIPTIIPYTKGGALTIDTEEDPLLLIGPKLSSSNAGLGNVYALIPVENATSTTQLPVTRIFKDTSIPNRLLRSLTDTYMIGVYTYDSQSPFIILKNSFFQNAFAGMLEWEKDMKDDLLPFIEVHKKTGLDTTATYTQFEDMIVANIDTRVIKNSLGETVLTYAFADKDTIVITTDNRTLKMILDKLLSVRTVQ